MEIEDARGYHAELRVPILILKVLYKSEMPISSHICDIVSCYSIPSAFFAGSASYLTKVEKQSEIVLIQILCIYILYAVCIFFWFRVQPLKDQIESKAEGGLMMPPRLRHRLGLVLTPTVKMLRWCGVVPSPV